MLPHFHLLTLGSPALLSAAGEQIRFRTRKHFAVLIRLALATGRRCTRAELMESLWPGVPERLARHSLAQAVTVVKAKLGREHVVVQRASLALAEGAVATDLDALDSGGADVRGRFLEGFEIPGSAAFEQWKDEWHARLLGRVRDALVRKMDAGRRIGEFASVERHAQTLLDLDPLSEDGVRGVMEARAWVGDRTNALKAFSRYEAALEEELGAKPSSDIVRMADLMRQGRRSPLRPPTTPEPPEARAERRMEPETIIGRSREFSILYDAWLDVRRRIPRVMVVTGDPGIGKTTLTNAFLSSCQMEGAVVARAQAYDAERELPYAVLAELVRQLTSQRAIGGADPDDLAELSRICADVNIAFPGVPKPPNWAAEVIPLRLADALLKTVKVASEENPVILVVDDIHAADNSTVAILHVIARKLDGTRAMLILGGRPFELRASGIAGSLEVDSSNGNLQRIELDSLNREDGERIIDQIVRNARGKPQSVPSDRIVSASNGNPLAIELLCHEWLTHGPESLLTVLEAVNTKPASTLGIPRAIAAVFQRQYQRIEGDIRATLDLAAVLGRDLVSLNLYRAVQLSEPVAAQALSQLRDLGFLRETHGSLEFRNELIRAQAYYAIAAQARQKLHYAVAETLSEGADSGPEPSDLQTAWHYLRSDHPEQALPFVIRGADQALRLGAPSEAEQLLFAMLQHPTNRTTKTRIELLLARSLLDQSKASAAEAILRAHQGHGDLDERRFAEVTAMRAEALYLTDDGSGAQYADAAHTALAAATSAGDRSLLAQALFEYARSGTVVGDATRVREVAARLNGILAESSLEHPPMMRYARAFCLFFIGDIDSATMELERVMSLLHESRERPTLALTFNGLGVLRRAKCEFEAAQHAFMEALSIATKMGDDHRRSVVANNLCILHTNHGDYEMGVRYGETSLHFAERAPRRADLFPIYDSLADAYLLAGNVERARACHEAGVRSGRQDRRWGEQMLYDLEYANFALVTGNTPMALEFGEKVERNGRGRELVVPDAGVYYKVVAFWTAHTRGDDQAWELLRPALDEFRQHHLLNYLVLIGVKAWLERRSGGDVSDETTDELKLFETHQMRGKRDLLRAQGFLT